MAYDPPNYYIFSKCMPKAEELDHAVARRKELRAGKLARKKEREAKSVMTKTELRDKMSVLRSEFLRSKSLDRFSRKLFEIAMNDDHQGQMAAMKMIADRILPTASFASESNKSSAVQINISGLQVHSVEAKDVQEDVVSLQ